MGWKNRMYMEHAQGAQCGFGVVWEALLVGDWGLNW